MSFVFILTAFCYVYEYSIILYIFNALKRFILRFVFFLLNILDSL